MIEVRIIPMQLKRLIFVNAGRSSQAQGEDNRESKYLQYALGERAHSLWRYPEPAGIIQDNPGR